MNTILSWLALVRPFNLLLLTVTPLALWASLVLPLLGEPELSARQVLLLGLAIALVAGAGNVVNDIADRTIDEYNRRPNPLLSGISVAHAWWLYAVLNVAALVVSIHLAQEVGDWWGLLAYPFAVGLLLAYSLALKCIPLLGNFVVAALCAAVPGFLLYAEPSLLASLPEAVGSHAMLAYCGFAFAGTMARELVKDLEDCQGDRQAGCRTLAVIWPQRRLHGLIFAWGFLALVTIAYVGFVYWRADVRLAAAAWWSVWLSLALTLSALKSTSGVEVTNYTRVSQYLKWTLGLALLVLIAYGRN